MTGNIKDLWGHLQIDVTLVRCGSFARELHEQLTWAAEKLHRTEDEKMS